MGRLRGSGGRSRGGGAFPDRRGELDPLVGHPAIHETGQRRDDRFRIRGHGDDVDGRARPRRVVSASQILRRLGPAYAGAVVQPTGPAIIRRTASGAAPSRRVELDRKPGGRGTSRHAHRTRRARCGRPHHRGVDRPRRPFLDGRHEHGPLGLGPLHMGREGDRGDPTRAHETPLSRDLAEFRPGGRPPSERSARQGVRAPRKPRTYRCQGGSDSQRKGPGSREEQNEPDPRRVRHDREGRATAKRNALTSFQHPSIRQGLVGHRRARSRSDVPARPYRIAGVLARQRLPRR